MNETCVDACERKAVNLQQEATFEEIQVGTIIIATGFKPFDATRIQYYGYGYVEPCKALKVAPHCCGKL